MRTLVGIELLKIFSKWRTYIGFIAIAVLVPIVQLAMHLEGQNTLDFYTRSLKDSFVFVGDLLNGYFVGYFILQALFIHIPFLVVLVGGDVLAGEATAGTYRLIATRPVSRFQILTSKFISGVIYTNFLLLWLAVLSLGISMWIFGSGDLLVLRNKIYIFAENDVIWRFLLAYGYATLSMTTVFSLAFLFSSLVENAIGPIIVTMAIIIIFTVISVLNIDFIQSIRPYLFTNHTTKWKDFFLDPVNLKGIVQSGLILLGHILAFYFITLRIFLKKDILT